MLARHLVCREMLNSILICSVHSLDKSFHEVKILQKSVPYIQRYSTKYASFLAMSYLTFTNEPWSYWTEFHEFSHDIQASYALLTCIARPWYCNSFSSSSTPNAGGFSRRWYIFVTIRLPWQRPLINLKRSYTSIICTLCALIWCKDCENLSSRSGDIRPNKPIFGHVIPDVHKWGLSTLELLDRISQNFHTIYRHHFYC